MTKTEQTRLVAWRLRVLQEAGLAIGICPLVRGDALADTRPCVHDSPSDTADRGHACPVYSRFTALHFISRCS
jgi:hypothetical protein